MGGVAPKRGVGGVLTWLRREWTSEVEVGMDPEANKATVTAFYDQELLKAMTGV
jgi:hypothetical protein